AFAAVLAASLPPPARPRSRRQPEGRGASGSGGSRDRWSRIPRPAEPTPRPAPAGPAPQALRPAAPDRLIGTRPCGVRFRRTSASAPWRISPRPPPNPGRQPPRRRSRASGGSGRRGPGARDVIRLLVEELLGGGFPADTLETSARDSAARGRVDLPVPARYEAGQLARRSSRMLRERAGALNWSSWTPTRKGRGRAREPSIRRYGP
ncbi:MAG: hypothetical protein MZU84_01245, partial [Sphingobacterium sp.]|nr:hypothetical protein [Sphingobacterium sp.]